MKSHHPDNVRIKHKYLGYLKEAKGHAEASLDSVAQALDRFENYTHLRDFKAFHPEQAKAFKAHLTGQVSLRSGERLTQATLYSTLRHLRAFFHWLAGQPGYRSKLTYADALRGGPGSAKRGYSSSCAVFGYGGSSQLGTIVRRQLRSQDTAAPFLELEPPNERLFPRLVFARFDQSDSTGTGRGRRSRLPTFSTNFCGSRSERNVATYQR
jgi:hypothetical protein